MNTTLTSDNGKWQVRISQINLGGIVKTTAMVIFTRNNIPVRVITRDNMNEAEALRLGGRMLDRASQYENIVDYDWGRQ